MTSFADIYRRLAIFAPLLAVTASLSFAHPKPTLRDTTVRAFESYVAKVQAADDRNLSHGNFLWLDVPDWQGRTEPFSKLRVGEVLVRRANSENEKTDVPGGLIHDLQGM